jgi:hypothetical protein
LWDRVGVEPRIKSTGFWFDNEMLSVS